jgi:hypothetical protein
MTAKKLRMRERKLRMRAKNLRMTASKLRMTTREVGVFMTTYRHQVDPYLRDESAGAEGYASRRAARSQRI